MFDLRPNVAEGTSEESNEESTIHVDKTSSWCDAYQACNGSVNHACNSNQIE